ncbi:MAG: portal protein, partial [Steroidobacteraceae bacterium]
MRDGMADDPDEDHRLGEIASHVGRLIQACEAHADRQKTERDRALEYYDGRMNDLPPATDMSKAVSRDVRGVVRKIMPSIMRTLLTSDRIVEYLPAGPGDEAVAKQATEYVNAIVLPESGAEDAIYDAIMDALIVKTGVLKWAAYEKRTVKSSRLSGQTVASISALMEEDGVEVLEAVDTGEVVAGVNEETGEPTQEALYDVRIRRMETAVDIRLEAVPRGSFLIWPEATTISESPIVGERQLLTRSALVSRGYDREIVASLSAYSSRHDDTDDRRARTGDDWEMTDTDPLSAMEEVELFEVYVYLDMDDDGIVELHKLCMAEGAASSARESGSYTILAMEMVDEAPYAELVVERTAHSFDGRSVAEDVEDIQRVKTALLRNSLDNIYWQNRPQPAIRPDLLTSDGLNAVMVPGFGKPIFLRSGATLQEAVQWHQVPFVANNTFAMLTYMDEEAKDRTGLTDQSGGVDPKAFADMTATTAQIMQESGVAQAAMMVRSLAKGGLRDAFRGLLRLVVAHADRSRFVWLREQWVEFNPRGWNSELDCQVQVGLGGGTRERDLAVLQMILGLQEKLVASIGPDNPFVKPGQIYNTLSRIVEAAGFPSAEPYFTEPDPAEVQQKIQQAGQQPSEAEMKAQTSMAMEKAKAEARIAVENAQMQADLRVKQQEIE